MVKLEDIKQGAELRGIEGAGVVRVVTTERVGRDALTVYYKDAEGRLGEQLLFREHESDLDLAETGGARDFDEPGAPFQLALEAFRIHLAHLFDPMLAVYTSNVEPLPHQISAVYEAMLPRQPLRYVLADDPGAGKTVMAGLLIRELFMRAVTWMILDAHREKSQLQACRSAEARGRAGSLPMRAAAPAGVRAAWVEASTGPQRETPPVRGRRPGDAISGGVKSETPGWSGHRAGDALPGGVDTLQFSLRSPQCQDLAAARGLRP